MQPRSTPAWPGEPNTSSSQITNPTFIPSAQFKYSFPLEDEEAPRRVLDRILDTAVLVPVKDLFAVSPEFWKQFRDLTIVKRVTNPSTNLVQVSELSSLDPDAVSHDFGNWVLRNNKGLIVTHHSLSLCAVEARIGSSGHVIQGVLDSGLKIIVMPKRIWEGLGLPI